MEKIIPFNKAWQLIVERRFRDFVIPFEKLSNDSLTIIGL